MAVFGPDFVVKIGDVELSNLEIPATINFGGKQKIGKHQLPGGARILDAMTQDDDDITWEGMFTGPDAFARARQLDGYRKTGEQVTLSYHTLSYTAIVAEFVGNFERYYQVPYRIVLMVVEDLSLPPALSPGNSVFDLLNSDLAQTLETALALGMGISSAIPGPVASSVGVNPQTPGITAPVLTYGMSLDDLAAALTVVREDTDAIVTPSGVTVASVAQLVAALQVAQNQCAALMAESETVLGVATVPGGVTAGSPDPAAFLSYLATCDQAVQINQQDDYLTRMNRNTSSGAL
jgi:hypothetical protein